MTYEFKQIDAIEMAIASAHGWEFVCVTQAEYVPYKEYKGEKRYEEGYRMVVSKFLVRRHRSGA